MKERFNLEKKVYNYDFKILLKFLSLLHLEIVKTMKAVFSLNLSCIWASHDSGNRRKNLKKIISPPFKCFALISQLMQVKEKIINEKRKLKHATAMRPKIFFKICFLTLLLKCEALQ